MQTLYDHVVIGMITRLRQGHRDAQPVIFEG
jgi:hypothetical protein